MRIKLLVLLFMFNNNNEINECCCKLLQHQPATMDMNQVRLASTGTASPAVKATGATTATATALPRKNSLVAQEEVRSHSRTHSLPTDIDKFMKKPPEYNEATKQLRKETEVNLNDILEIISKQDSAVKFEVSRNPDTGLVTLKEATRDTPKTSQIVTPDIKTPVIINNSSSRLFEKENLQTSSEVSKHVVHANHFDMKQIPDSNNREVRSFKGATLRMSLDFLFQIWLSLFAFDVRSFYFLFIFVLFSPCGSLLDQHTSSP